VQHWDTFRAAIKATQQGPTLQLDVSAGAVQPAGPLSQLLASAGANPADLVNDRRLLAAAQDAIKGAKVRVRRRGAIVLRVHHDAMHARRATSLRTAQGCVHRALSSSQA
jgi:hypothetical protein